MAEMRKYPGAFTEEQFNTIVTNIAVRSGIETADDLFNMIGYGGLSVNKISTRLRDEYDKIVTPPEETPITDVSQI